MIKWFNYHSYLQLLQWYVLCLFVPNNPNIAAFTAFEVVEISFMLVDCQANMDKYHWLYSYYNKNSLNYFYGDKMKTDIIITNIDITLTDKMVIK